MFQVQNLKQSLDGQRKDLNDCRAEITSLKMQIEEAHSQRNLVANTSELYESPSVDGYNEEMKLLVNEIQSLKASQEERNAEEKDEVGGLHDINIPECTNGLSLGGLRTQDSQLLIDQTSEVVKKPEELSVPPVENSLPEKTENFTAFNGEVPTETNSPVVKPDSLVAESIPEKMVNSLIRPQHTMFTL